MKKIAVMLALASSLPLFAEPALAISRYNSLGMSCAAARDAIASQGAVILRHPSQHVRGMTLYDRYVRNDRYCETHEYAERANVPTRDDPKCPVLNCQPRNDDNDFPLLFPGGRN